MSIERQPGVGSGAPGTTPPATGGLSAEADGGAAGPALRLQVLAAEHWSLLASRSLAWTEIFTRATMYLTTLSATVVALALVAQATDFGESFRQFALAVLPVALFIGVGTWLRLSAANYHDALCVVGMNRIRAAYLEIDPELERYFVMSAHDDSRGVARTMALAPRMSAAGHFVSATPQVVSTLNSVVFAAIVALLAVELGAGHPAALGLGAVGFLGSTAAHLGRARRAIAAAREELQPRFPSPSP